MRTEKEMFELILGVAAADERIRAVYMNGSRTNPNVPKDIFQDYDIVYVVTKTEPFYEDKTWIDLFGSRLYKQMPDQMDAMRGVDLHLEDRFCWLIQFADGNRLDLTLQTIPYAKTTILEDKLCKILIDKDHLLPEIPESTEEDYYVKCPSYNDFVCDCNNFWWCMNNVAKGLWREEIPYVMDMLNQVIRPHLVNILSWKIGIDHDFSCSIGKSGKYMYRYLNEDMWERFLKTYSDAIIEHIWEAVMVMCHLFDEAAKEVAKGLGYIYNQEEADASWGYLEHVRYLPKDAKEVYR